MFHVKNYETVSKFVKSYAEKTVDYFPDTVNN